MSNAGGWKSEADPALSMEGRVTGWLDRVPGYRGDRAKEDRRDADRAVRDLIAADLIARADRVAAIARELANTRRLVDIAPVDELHRTIRHLADRVRTASYGYGGLFSNRDVDESALDQLQRFDESLLAGVLELDAPVAAMESALSSGGALAAAAKLAGERATMLHRRLDLRDRVIESGEPADQGSIDAVLEPEARPSAPVYDIGANYAIALMGDNFVVDARVDVSANVDSFRLFRLEGGSPEQWLLAPLDDTRGYARLAKLDVAAPSSDDPTIDGIRYTADVAGTGNGEQATADRASGRRPVAFALYRGADDPSKRAVALNWQGETMVYAGSDVHPADIEIFGSAGA